MGTLGGAGDNYNSLRGWYSERRPSLGTSLRKEGAAHWIPRDRRLFRRQVREGGFGRGCDSRRKAPFRLHRPAGHDVREVDNERPPPEPRGDASREAAIAAGAEHRVGRECAQLAAGCPGAHGERSKASSHPERAAATHGRRCYLFEGNAVRFDLRAFAAIVWPEEAHVEVSAAACAERFEDRHRGQDVATGAATGQRDAHQCTLRTMRRESALPPLGPRSPGGA